MPGEPEDRLPGTSDAEPNCAANKPVKQFTWHELSKLNSRHNAHVAYRGKVYDVSEFIRRHPGGADQIMLGAGRDITQLFDSYHKLEIVNTMKKFYVGELVDNEMPVFPEMSDFYITLRQRVDEYFKTNNIDPKIDYWMFLRYFTIIMLCFTCMSILVCFHTSWLICIPTSIVWGFFSALAAMTFSHDASHFAVTHKPWVWKLVGSVHDFYHGSSMYAWMYQHIIGHHLYTNIDGADPDVVTSSADVGDFRRIKWSQKWLGRYFYQHIYVPMLYCLLTIKTRLQDFPIIISQMNANIRMNPLTQTQWSIFLGGKTAFFLTRFILPGFFMPISSMLLYNIICDMVTSYWLAIIFQVSHINTEVEWPKPDANNFVNMDWAEMQVATTQDYATNSWFWNVCTGALNHQTTHHLFPGIIQSHYPKITPIIKQTCEEFGIKYHYVDTSQEALDCHIKHLKRLGQEKKYL